MDEGSKSAYFFSSVILFSFEMPYLKILRIDLIDNKQKFGKNWGNKSVVLVYSIELHFSMICSSFDHTLKV